MLKPNMWPLRDSESQLVRDAYRLLFDREPDPGGLKHYTTMLKQGMSREDLLRILILSAEFQTRMAAAEFLPKYEDIDIIVPVGDFKLWVPASDRFLVPYLIEHRSWEPHITECLRRIAKPSDVFVDVGASIGYFSILMSPLVKEVIAFEPTTYSYKYLERNIKLNNLYNIILYKKGLWNENVKLPISVDPSNITASSMSQGTEEIDCITLDSLRIAPSIIKMDIEGAEINALEGMQETIRRSCPTIIMEMNRPRLQEFGKTISDIWNFYEKIDYKITALLWQGESKEIRDLVELNQICPADGIIDLLCVPNPR
jgi:FkbM family methyltransferase